MRFILLILCGSIFSSGCAALSLFDSTHTHTHHHDCDLSEAQQRISTLEQRIDELEQRQGNRSSSLEQRLKPIEMSGGPSWHPKSAKLEDFGPFYSQASN